MNSYCIKEHNIRTGYKTESEFSNQVTRDRSIGFYPQETTNINYGHLYEHDRYVQKKYYLILDNVYSELKKCDSCILKKQAKDISNSIQGCLEFIDLYGFDLSLLPKISFKYIEDNSILIEWIFTDFRIGFNLEQNVDDSGWYLTTNNEFGQLNASGFLSGLNKRTIIMWLLLFVVINV